MNGKLRVGIVGVGNCASSFVQGLSFYGDARSNEPVPGLMHADLGGYHVRDIEISAAFDVHKTKVGRDVSEEVTPAQPSAIVPAQPSVDPGTPSSATPATG